MEDLKQWSELRQKYSNNLPSAEKRVQFQENWSIRELRNHREKAELQLDRIIESRPAVYEFSSSSDDDSPLQETPHFVTPTGSDRYPEETKSQTSAKSGGSKGDYESKQPISDNSDLRSIDKISGHELENRSVLSDESLRNQHDKASEEKDDSENKEHGSTKENKKNKKSPEKRKDSEKKKKKDKKQKSDAKDPEKKKKKSKDSQSPEKSPSKSKSKDSKNPEKRSSKKKKDVPLDQDVEHHDPSQHKSLHSAYGLEPDSQYSDRPISLAKNETDSHKNHTKPEGPKSPTSIHTAIPGNVEERFENYSGPASQLRPDKLKSHSSNFDKGDKSAPQKRSEKSPESIPGVKAATRSPSSQKSLSPGSLFEETPKTTKSRNEISIDDPSIAVPEVSPQMDTEIFRSPKVKAAVASGKPQHGTEKTNQEEQKSASSKPKGKTGADLSPKDDNPEQLVTFGSEESDPLGRRQYFPESMTGQFQDLQNKIDADEAKQSKPKKKEGTGNKAQMPDVDEANLSKPKNKEGTWKKDQMTDSDEALLSKLNIKEGTGNKAQVPDADEAQMSKHKKKEGTGNKAQMLDADEAQPKKPKKKEGTGNKAQMPDADEAQLSKPKKKESTGSKAQMPDVESGELAQRLHIPDSVEELKANESLSDLELSRDSTSVIEGQEPKELTLDENVAQRGQKSKLDSQNPMSSGFITHTEDSESPQVSPLKLQPLQEGDAILEDLLESGEQIAKTASFRKPSDEEILPTDFDATRQEESKAPKTEPTLDEQIDFIETVQGGPKRGKQQAAPPGMAEPESPKQTLSQLNENIDFLQGRQRGSPERYQNDSDEEAVQTLEAGDLRESQIPVSAAATFNLVRVLALAFEKAKFEAWAAGFSAMHGDDKLHLSTELLSKDLRMIEEALKKYSDDFYLTSQSFNSQEFSMTRLQTNALTKLANVLESTVIQPALKDAFTAIDLYDPVLSKVSLGYDERARLAIRFTAQLTGFILEKSGKDLARGFFGIQTEHIYQLKKAEVNRRAFAWYAFQLLAKSLHGWKLIRESQWRKEQKEAEILEFQKKWAYIHTYMHFNAFRRICQAHKQWVEEVKTELHLRTVRSYYENWILYVRYKMAKHCLAVFKAKRVLQAWNSYTKFTRERDMKGYLFWYNSLIFKALTAWKDHQDNRKKQAHKNRMIRMYYNRRVLKLLFAQWVKRCSPEFIPLRITKKATVSIAGDRLVNRKQLDIRVINI